MAVAFSNIVSRIEDVAVTSPTEGGCRASTTGCGVGYCGIGFPDLQPGFATGSSPSSSSRILKREAAFPDTRPLPTPHPAPYHGSMRDQLPPCPRPTSEEMRQNVAKQGRKNCLSALPNEAARPRESLDWCPKNVSKCPNLSQKCPKPGTTSSRFGPKKGWMRRRSCPIRAQMSRNVSQI